MALNIFPQALHILYWYCLRNSYILVSMSQRTNHRITTTRCKQLRHLLNFEFSHDIAVDTRYLKVPTQSALAVQEDYRPIHLYKFNQPCDRLGISSAVQLIA
jgi:hypothetical protein